MNGRFEPGAWTVGLALLLVGAALALPRLGASGLWDPWEPRYVRAAEEMAERGDWVVPYYRGEARVNRPPGTYWLIGLSHQLFGSGEASSRLPMALLAIACSVSLGVALALRGRAWEGLLAGAALITSPQWLLLGRFATIALPLAAFLGMALAVVIALPRFGTRNAQRAAFAAIVVLIAAAALTDFPRGLLLPAWAVLGWGLLSRRALGVLSFLAVATSYHTGQLVHSAPLILLSYALALVASLTILKRLAGVSLRVLLGGAALVTLLVAPWFVAAGVFAGDELKVFNYKYALNLGEDPGEHTGPYLYVLAIVAAGSLAWAPAALAGLWSAIGTKSKRDGPALVFAGASIGTLAFFVLAEARMGHFYAAASPALAGLAGVGLVSVVRSRGWSGAVLLAALAGVLVLVRDDPTLVLESATVKGSLYGIDLATPLTLSLVAWTVLVGVAWVARRPSWSVAAVLPAALFTGYLALVVVPALSRHKSFEATWNLYLEHRRPGEPLGLFGVSSDSAFYYAREAEELFDAADVREFFSRPGAQFLALPKKRIDALLALDFVDRERLERLDETHPNYALVRYAGGPPR